MTIQQCNYVLKIAACGSFNEAAKDLFVAQSSLSVSVKALEQELGIRIFHRAGNGVYLTEEGTEFARYARQLTQQHAFVLNRYQSPPRVSRLYVSTQHYDFVADIFVRLINETQEDSYRFSLREMKTYDVIHETEMALCDVGIIAIKGSDYSIMERYIAKRGLCFTPFLKAVLLYTSSMPRFFSFLISTKWTTSTIMSFIRCHSPIMSTLLTNPINFFSRSI